MWVWAVGIGLVLLGAVAAVARWLTRQMDLSDRQRIREEVERHGGRVVAIDPTQGGTERGFDVRYVDAAGNARHRPCLTSASLGVFWEDDDEEEPPLPVDEAEVPAGEEAPPAEEAAEDPAACDAAPGACGCAAPVVLGAGSEDFARMPLLPDPAPEAGPRPLTPDDVPSLVEMLRSGDPRRCRVAIEGLVGLGSAALPALEPFASDPDPDVRIDVEQAVRRIRESEASARG